MMLLVSDPDGVRKLIEKYDKEVADIKRTSMQLSWYMRGGLSYEDILNMSVEERGYINKIIEQNLETTKTSKLPFF